MNIELIKKLREQTGVSITECKKALEQAGHNIEKALGLLEKSAVKIAARKAQRETKQGIIDSYIHANKKIGVLLELLCETDFVAKSREFQTLAHELCLHIAALEEGEDSPPLLQQPWIKDPQKTIKVLIDDYVAKLGENIKIGRISKFSLWY